MAAMTTSPDLEIAPEPPPAGPALWLKNNFFQTPASGVLSILSIMLVLVTVRGVMALVFDPSQRWDAVTFNMKLLMVLAYPSDQMFRVWLSIGIVVILMMASLAIWKVGGRAEPRHVGRTLMSIGGSIAVAGLLSPFSVSGKAMWIGAGAVLLAIGWALRNRMGARTKEPLIPVLGLVGIAVGFIIVGLWTLDLPWPADIDGVQVIVQEPIAMTTRVPWTVLYFVGIATYLLVNRLASLLSVAKIRSTLMLLWTLSFPVIVLIVLRAPELDFGRLITWYLPIFVVFASVGWLVISYTARPSTGELGRVIGAVLLIVALGSFAFPMEFIFRFLLLALALFTLGGPAFGGEGENQRKYLMVWVWTSLAIVVVSWVVLNQSGIDVPSESFLGGFMLTIVLALTSIVLSFPLGVILALGRTSTMPIFRLMATTFIELVRGVPLITWLLVAFIMLPAALPSGVTLTGPVVAIGAMTFFTAAYLAENVRGGLQSVASGQKEAAKALGLSVLQMTVFITLPQALRTVIPAIVGQVIGLFKNTSLVTLVGLFDILNVARAVIPNQSQPFNFLGTRGVTLIFAAFVYWIFTFSFSRVSQNLEKKLGVGDR